MYHIIRNLFLVRTLGLSNPINWVKPRGGNGCCSILDVSLCSSFCYGIISGIHWITFGGINICLWPFPFILLQSNLLLGSQIRQARSIVHVHIVWHDRSIQKVIMNWVRYPCQLLLILHRAVASLILGVLIWGQVDRAEIICLEVGHRTWSVLVLCSALQLSVFVLKLFLSFCVCTPCTLRILNVMLVLPPILLLNIRISGVLCVGKILMRNRAGHRCLHHNGCLSISRLVKHPKVKSLLRAKALSRVIIFETLELYLLLGFQCFCAVIDSFTGFLQLLGSLVEFC